LYLVRARWQQVRPELSVTNKPVAWSHPAQGGYVSSTTFIEQGGAVLIGRALFGGPP
jgi:hypothetical protein